jgi:pimeloyl-ACP methyl ester carboxylesterase
MEPEIRYATTVDGVSIAYWSIGNGPPLIDLGQPPFSHLRLEWEIPEIRAWYERIAANHQFVRLDTRGTGLSDRDISAYSVETQVCDVEAVVAALRLDRFALLGAINSGPAAIMYAARHPQQVSELILWCAYTRGAEFFDDTGTRTLRDMLYRDWNMFTETASHSRLGWDHGDHARRIAEVIRASVTPDVQAMLMDTLQHTDVTSLLPLVQAPTLVLQREARGADVAAPHRRTDR